MPKYYLYLKSHCEALDYDDECSAKTGEEAIKKFLKNPALREWNAEMLKDKVFSEEELNKKEEIT